MMRSFVVGLGTGVMLCVSTVGYIEYAHQNAGGVSGYIFPLISKLESSTPIQPSKSFSASPKPSSDADTGKVLRVIDGDTIDVALNGERHRVRYIGINAPERDEPCFDEATEANIDLVASSGAYRLKAEGINVKVRITPSDWFLKGPEDVRSCHYLEDIACEFDIQGLELDWVGMCWDADLRYKFDDETGGGWSFNKFRGARWTRANKEERKMYLKNA